MTIETKKLLLDVASACQSLAAFTAGRRFDEYEADDLVRSAVERKFEIVGEALTRLRETDSLTFGGIPDAPVVIGLRNRIIHGYDAVNHRILWDIIQNELPKLKVHVERLLGDSS